MCNPFKERSKLMQMLLVIFVVFPRWCIVWVGNIMTRDFKDFWVSSLFSFLLVCVCVCVCFFC